MEDYFYGFNQPNNDNGSGNEPPRAEQTNNPYAPVPPPVQNTPYTPYSPPQYEQPVPPQGGAPDPFGQLPQKPKKKNKTLAVILIVIAACCLFAVFGVWASSHLYTDSHNNSSSSSQSQSDSKSDSDSDSKEKVTAKVESSDANPEKDADGNYTVVGVAKNTRDSCVGITVYTDQSDFYSFYNYGEQNSNSSEKVASGEGSGVIMAEQNGKTYILTCAHVISGGDSFTVTLDNDKEYKATMVGFDSQTDIGVLSIDATGLQVATFGDSKDIEVGESCVAIGCPGGLTFKNSVTVGVVSGLDVPISSSIGYKNECIQVDAAINPGNSGGALFNMQGQVIGINSSKIASTEYEGMGFAVPSNTARETALSLIENGYVAGRAKIGIEYNTLQNYTSANNILGALERKGFKNAQGTMVIQTISEDSDLYSKGIKQYDMIVAVDGETLTSTDVMTSKLAASKPGDTVTLTIARIENNQIKIAEIKCKLIESKG